MPTDAENVRLLGAGSGRRTAKMSRLTLTGISQNMCNETRGRCRIRQADRRDDLQFFHKFDTLQAQREELSCLDFVRDCCRYHERNASTGANSSFDRLSISKASDGRQTFHQMSELLS